MEQKLGILREISRKAHWRLLEVSLRQVREILDHLAVRKEV